MDSQEFSESDSDFPGDMGLISVEVDMEKLLRSDINNIDSIVKQNTYTSYYHSRLMSVCFGEWLEATVAATERQSLLNHLSIVHYSNYCISYVFRAFSDLKSRKNTHKTQTKMAKILRRLI